MNKEASGSGVNFQTVHYEADGPSPQELAEILLRKIQSQLDTLTLASQQGDNGAGKVVIDRTTPGEVKVTAQTDNGTLEYTFFSDGRFEMVVDGNVAPEETLDRDLIRVHRLSTLRSALSTELNTLPSRQQKFAQQFGEDVELL